MPKLPGQNPPYELHLQLRQRREVIATQHIQMTLPRRNVHLLRLRERIKQCQLALRQRDHIFLRYDHQHRRGCHVLHDSMRLPGDDLVVRLKRRPVLVVRRPTRLRIYHVVELLLVGANSHPSRVLPLFRQDRQKDGRVACQLRFAILHALGQHTRELLRRQLKIEQRTDRDTQLGAFVQARGAERNRAGEGHAPKRNGIRINGRQRPQEAESI